jgi:hypothetical protein
MGILDDVEFTKPFLFCMISCYLRYTYVNLA